MGAGPDDFQRKAMSTSPESDTRALAPDRLNEFLRQVVAAFREEHRSDVELLARFVESGDHEAFRAIVARYGQSVWATCMAVLGDLHDAEDAFQAAFMALAKRARTVDARRGIGPWVREIGKSVV